MQQASKKNGAGIFQMPDALVRNLKSAGQMFSPLNGQETNILLHRKNSPKGLKFFSMCYNTKQRYF